MSTNDFKARPSVLPRIIAAVLALAWCVLIAFLSSIEGAAYPEHPGFLNYIAHFGEYLVLSALVTIAVNGGGRALWKSALIAVVFTSLYAASDEVHQYFVPGRMSDPLDWLTDTIGALVGAAGIIFYLSSKKVKASRRRDEKK